MKSQYFLYFLLISLHCFTPAHAEDAGVRIVENSTYHGDEVADVKDGESWIAIAKADDAYIAKHVRVSVKTVKDEIVDQPNGPFTGKMITSDPAAVFLIKGLPIKAGAAITSYAVDTTAIEGGKSVEIKSDKTIVKLAGQDKLYFKGDGWETHDAYQLIGTIGNSEFTLMPPTTLDANFPHVIWAGDLNNDDYPDMLIDTTDHYNLSNPTLFMSEPTPKGVTYKKVAERRSAGC